MTSIQSLFSQNIVDLRNSVEKSTGLTFFRFINWLHLLILAPLVFIVGYMGQSTPTYMYWLLGLVAVWTLFYHFAAWFAPDRRTWIIALHIAIIAPILAYFAYWRDDLPASMFDILIVVAGSAFFYHFYALLRY
jgi:hypothetical protein